MKRLEVEIIRDVKISDRDERGIAKPVEGLKKGDRRLLLEGLSRDLINMGAAKLVEAPKVKEAPEKKVVEPTEVKEVAEEKEIKKPAKRKKRAKKVSAE